MAVGLLVLLAVGLIAGRSAADTELKIEPAPPNAVDDLRSGVTTRVQNLAETFDEFLSDREYENERNDTEVRLRFDLDLSNDEDPKLVLRPRVRLRLPHTEQVLLVDIGGNRTEDGDEGSGNSGLLPNDDEQQDNTAVRLRLPNQVGDVRVAPEAGIGFTDNSANVFAGVRFSRTWNFKENYLVFASQRFRAYTDRGGQSVTYARLDHELRSKILMRGDTKVEWREDRSGWRIRPGFIMRGAAGKKGVLSWENYVTFKTSPDLHTDSAITSLRYRRLLYRDWLYGEVVPWGGTEHDSDGYTGVYGVRLRVDINF